MGVTIPEGEGVIFGENMYPTSLTAADAWLQALDESIINREGGSHTAGEVWYLLLPCSVTNTFIRQMAVKPNNM